MFALVFGVYFFRFISGIKTSPKINSKFTYFHYVNQFCTIASLPTVSLIASNMNNPRTTLFCDTFPVWILFAPPMLQIDTKYWTSECIIRRAGCFQDGEKRTYFSYPLYSDRPRSLREWRSHIKSVYISDIVVLLWIGR